MIGDALTSAIASTSVSAGMTGVMQQVNVSTTKMAMDTQTETVTNLIEDMMPAAGSFGHKLDITV